MPRRILIIEDEPTMRLGLQHFLSSQGYRVDACVNGEAGMAFLAKHPVDLVITDLRMPRKDGFAVLAEARALVPDVGVIIMTAYAEVKDAVQAVKQGAYDYIAKPFSDDELLTVLDRYFKMQSLESEVEQLRARLGESDGLGDFVVVSPAMQGILDQVAAVAGTDSPVLVLGESGTGKELIANAIHSLSGRRQGPFVKINCAAIPESLFESELFGFERGAFTGAAEGRGGKFEFAEGGTLFFDEIAEVPLPLQAKLLRVIEEKAVTRLGGNRSVPVNVRTIYATSKNLKQCVEQGSFRQDLFYRINVVPILLPPLRTRPEAIPHLIDHFVRLYALQMGKGDVTIAPDAYDALLAYAYPGNVRELKHAIERALVFVRQNGIITLQQLPDEISSQSAVTPCYSGKGTLSDSVKCLERVRIVRALEDAGGRKLEAARLLGIGRKALWKKIKQYGI